MRNWKGRHRLPYTPSSVSLFRRCGIRQLKTTAHDSSGQRLAAQRDGEETVDLAGTIAAKAKADEEDIDEDDDE